MAEKRYVFAFKCKEGEKLGRNYLGGKGANLAEMTRIPFLFHKVHRPTEACNLYYNIAKITTICD